MADKPQTEVSLVDKALKPFGQENVSILDKLVPKEVADANGSEAYLALVAHKVMKTDKDGKMRPFGDFLYFMTQVNRTKLDPIARQIYAVYRFNRATNSDEMTIQTSIDGFRVIAERSGYYAGSDDAIFEEDQNGKPKKATITVYRLNPKTRERMAVTASARFEEYNVGDSPMWRKMPFNMLAKCAEALALRKAFPQDLSGLYTEDEMMQADVVKTKRTPAVSEDAKALAAEAAEHTKGE